MNLILLIKAVNVGFIGKSKADLETGEVLMQWVFTN